MRCALAPASQPASPTIRRHRKTPKLKTHHSAALARRSSYLSFPRRPAALLSACPGVPRQRAAPLHLPRGRGGWRLPRSLPAILPSTNLRPFPCCPTRSRARRTLYTHQPPLDLTCHPWCSGPGSSLHCCMYRLRPCLPHRYSCTTYVSPPSPFALCTYTFLPPPASSLVHAGWAAALQFPAILSPPRHASHPVSVSNTVRQAGEAQSQWVSRLHGWPAPRGGAGGAAAASRGNLLPHNPRAP